MYSIQQEITDPYETRQMMLSGQLRRKQVLVLMCKDMVSLYSDIFNMMNNMSTGSNTYYSSHIYEILMSQLTHISRVDKYKKFFQEYFDMANSLLNVCRHISTTKGKKREYWESAVKSLDNKLEILSQVHLY